MNKNKLSQNKYDQSQNQGNAVQFIGLEPPATTITKSIEAVKKPVNIFCEGSRGFYLKTYITSLLPHQYHNRSKKDIQSIDNGIV